MGSLEPALETALNLREWLMLAGLSITVGLTIYMAVQFVRMTWKMK